MPKKTTQIKIPTILGLLFLLIGIVAGVLIIQNQQIFRSRADENKGPQNVTITNIKDTSFVVSWTTPEELSGQVSWGKSQNSLGNSTTTSPKSKVHHIQVQGLTPDTTYYFQVISDNKTYLNGSSAWEITTAQILPPPSYPNVTTGKILNPDGSNSSGAVVYMSTGVGSSQSTITSASGRWIIPLSEMRNRDLSSYLIVDDSSVVNLRISDGLLESNVTALVSSLKPAPEITLGNDYNFTNIDNQSSSFSNPASSINVINQQQASTEKKTETINKILTPTPTVKSDPSPTAGSTEEVVVTIDSVKDSEIIDDTLPEFFGSGSPNLEITITVESDPITETIEVNDDGLWSWLPPLELEEGIHTITITYMGSDGFLKTIQRQFEVQAAGDSSSVVTPSPTPRPTSTPKPTITSQTITSPSPTKTPAQLPDSGSIANTVAMISIILIAASGSAIFLLK